MECNQATKNCYPRPISYLKRNLMVAHREQRDWKMPDFGLLHRALNPTNSWPPNTSIHINSTGTVQRKPPAKPPKPSSATNAGGADLLDLDSFPDKPVSVAPVDPFSVGSDPFAEVTSPLVAISTDNIFSTEVRCVNEANVDPFSEFIVSKNTSSENSALNIPQSTPSADDPFSAVLNSMQSSTNRGQETWTDDPFAGL